MGDHSLDQEIAELGESSADEFEPDSTTRIIPATDIDWSRDDDWLDERDDVDDEDDDEWGV